MSNKISVIIPTYKEPEYLDLCIKSAISGQFNKNQILVIVDGFYDLNKSVLDKYKGEIDVVILEENQGLCRATNIGVYNAKYDLILVVNDDNVFPMNWDVDLLSSFQSGSVLSPNQIEPNPSIFNQFHIKDLGKTIDNFDLHKFTEYSLTVKRDEVDEDCGSTLPFMMSKRDYLRLGGWDENYPTNGVVADWDFFLKCNLSEFKMTRTYKCHFYHFAQVATGAQRQEQEIQGHEYARYKWGSYIKHDPESNLKYVD
jgi:glycosyltransferase involved in cell wall biosynthesis